MVRYTTMLRLPLDQITEEARDFQKAGAGIVRVQQLLDLHAAADGTSGAWPSAVSEGVPADRPALPPGPLSVELDGVSFAYGAGRETLHDVTFHLPAKSVLGIVGRTGSGKTTLTRLLTRLYAPSTGSIRVGGIDIRRIAADDLYRRVAVVTQDVQLFRASARDNICLFDPSIPSERVEEVLAELGLSAWLRSLPEGLDTQLSPQRGGFSAGEAQLVAFARVFLRDPDLVILDEASSRLDRATERLIEHAVDRLLAGRTGIVVAHRLSTLRRVDDVLVVEDGTVLEHGSRERLARDPHSRFHQLLATAGVGAPSWLPG
jgi:ABC-type multidrug transport system fused ATPase/permease subunit